MFGSQSHKFSPEITVTDQVCGLLDREGKRKKKKKNPPRGTNCKRRQTKSIPKGSEPENAQLNRRELEKEMPARRKKQEETNWCDRNERQPYKTLYKYQFLQRKSFAAECRASLYMPRTTVGPVQCCHTFFLFLSLDRAIRITIMHSPTTLPNIIRTIHKPTHTSRTNRHIAQGGPGSANNSVNSQKCDSS